MDKWIGAMFLVIILALAAIGSFTTYTIFTQNSKTPDTYGNQFGNTTNSTVKVEQAVAPVSISVMGYITLMAVIIVIVGGGVLVFKATAKGIGGGRGMR